MYHFVRENDSIKKEQHMWIKLIFNTIFINTTLTLNQCLILNDIMLQLVQRTIDWIYELKNTSSVDYRQNIM